jgi:clathrin heavy chain
MASGGVLCIDRRGVIFSITANEDCMATFIAKTLGDPVLAMRVAGGRGLPEAVLVERFDELLRAGDIKGAVLIALQAPPNLLRTAETIAKLQQQQQETAAPSPILVYLGVLLDAGKLNKIESLEAARIIVGQGRMDLLETWIKAGKFELCEELGDVLQGTQPNLALQVYLECQANEKVITSLLDQGRADRVPEYCQKVGVKLDIAVVARVLDKDPDAAAELVGQMISGGTIVTEEVAAIVDMLIDRGLAKQATAVLLQLAKEDDPEHGRLQTRCLEINLRMVPQVADAIFSFGLFKHFDRDHIGRVCEEVGLYSRAIECFSQPLDIRRVVFGHTSQITHDALVASLPKLSADDALDLLRALFRDPCPPLPLIVQVALQHKQLLTVAAVVSLFKEFHAWNELLCFLLELEPFEYDAAQVREVVLAADIQDPDLHRRLLELAQKTGLGTP